MEVEILSVQEKQIQKAGLIDILEKVLEGRRLSFDDGVRLYKTDDILSLGFLANIVRERFNGNKTYFVKNHIINYSNICELDCKFCSFYRKEGQDGAYRFTLEQIFDKIRPLKDEIVEVHIVGALDPKLPWDYYLDMLRGIKEINPNINIKAFTAVEIDYFAKNFGKTYEEVLVELKNAGLDTIPGGGAEVFSERVRQRLFPDKIGANEWLEVHRIAHKLGIRTNATMLYGHMETIEERVIHLMKLRELQDETGGFLAFIPLPYHPKNNKYAGDWTTGLQNLKSFALARLMLDNFPHIKCFWVSTGVKVAQISQSFGVDDLDGTVREERIYHMAGADTSQYLSKNQLIKLIKDAGRVPVERDAYYNVIAEY
jgi:aminodeoxyfutalosine synthase